MDDTALAQAEQALSALEAQYGLAAPAPADDVGSLTPQGAPNMPPTGYAPCDAYKEFWFSRIQDGGGTVQLTLSNTLPGLQYVILQANHLTNASWTSVQPLTAAGYVTVFSPISVGAGATYFFRAQLGQDYSGPVVLNPPQDMVVPQGTPVTLTVVATGNPAPGYQWEFNGSAIPGATLSALSIPSAQPANVGTYTVIVSNVICQASASASLGLTWTNLLDSAISASPAVSTNGMVFIATMTQFYALDPLQGTVIWQTNLDNPNSGDLAPSAALAPDNSAVYVASQDGSVLALNPTNGALLWSNNLGGPIYASPAVSAADGTVYVVCEPSVWPGSALFALDPATGATNWFFQPSDWAAPGTLSDASPAIGPDCTIYFLATGGDLYAVHPDGSLAWFFPLPAYSAPQSSPALDSTGNLLVGSADGYLYCISPAGGLKWLFDVGDIQAISASPAVGLDNTVYAASSDGALFAITNGALKWQITLTNGSGATLQLVSSPAVTASNVVFIGAQDNSGAQGLYAITNGALMAFYPTAAGVYSSPAISPADSAVIIADMAGSVYKFPGQGPLAADAPWPAFRRNAPHTGSTPDPVCAGGGQLFVFPSNPNMNVSASQFSFYLSGTPGSTWSISASTNLVDWTPLGSATLDPNLGIYAVFTDTVTGFTNRFYRASSGQTCS